MAVNKETGIKHKYSFVRLKCTTLHHYTCHYVVVFASNTQKASFCVTATFSYGFLLLLFSADNSREFLLKGLGLGLGFFGFFFKTQPKREKRRTRDKPQHTHGALNISQCRNIPNTFLHIQFLETLHRRRA